METVSLEREVVRQRNKIDLLEQENSDLRVDLVERIKFNRLMLDSKLDLYNENRDTNLRIDKIEKKLVDLESRKETKFSIFKNGQI